MIYLHNSLDFHYQFKVIIVLLAFTYSSCSKNDKEIRGRIDKQVFFQILDTLDVKHNLKNKQIMIGRYESDEVIDYVKENLKDELENDTTGPSKMVKELIYNLGDSIYLEIENDNDYYNIEWGYTGKKSLREKFSKDMCILYISEPIYIKNGKMGCFYLSIGQVEKPGAYIIFIGKISGEWEIISIHESWG